MNSVEKNILQSSGKIAMIPPQKENVFRRNKRFQHNTTGRNGLTRSKLSNLEIRIRRPQDGLFIASCPDLRLYCQAASEREALDKMNSLIAFHLTHASFIESGKPVGNEQLRHRPVSDGSLFIPYRVNRQ